MFSRRLRGTPRGWSIDFLANAVADGALGLVDDPPDAELLHARLADHIRDMGHAPPGADVLAAMLWELDEPAQRRLAVAVTLLQYEDVRAPLQPVIESGSVAQLISSLAATAREMPSIDLPLLARSMVRAEEFARRLASTLDIAFDGEDPRRSAERLSRIDYQRLLAKVDAAKLSAEERMEALLKQQEQDDDRIQRVRRGKW
jgi:hypothetical protein